MTEQAISIAEIRRELSQQCEVLGSQSAWARRFGFPVSQVCETLKGRRDPSEGMINALGFIRVVRYIKKERKN